VGHSEPLTKGGQAPRRLGASPPFGRRRSFRAPHKRGTGTSKTRSQSPFWKTSVIQSPSQKGDRHLEDSEPVPLLEDVGHSEPLTEGGQAPRRLGASPRFGGRRSFRAPHKRGTGTSKTRSQSPFWRTSVIQSPS